MILTKKERERLQRLAVAGFGWTARDQLSVLETLDAHAEDAARLAKFVAAERALHSCERGREELGWLCLPGNVCPDCHRARAMDEALAAHRKLAEEA